MPSALCSFRARDGKTMTEFPQPDYKNISLPTKSRKRWYSYLADGALIILVIGLSAIMAYGFYSYKAYKIPTGSMEPTLLIGDNIITLRYFTDQKPDRGDIVIFPFPYDREKDFVKRIVGLPGETLEIRQQQVYINNMALDEPYALHTQPPQSPPLVPRDDLAPMIIPDGQVFVIGDNRENSNDSRMFGPLEVTDIERQVKIIYWSWNHEESTIRWKRIGKAPE